MSAERNDSKPRDVRKTLDEILDFGPDNPPPSQDFTERVRKILKSIQEISQRIDRLNERY